MFASRKAKVLFNGETKRFISVDLPALAYKQ